MRWPEALTQRSSPFLFSEWFPLSVSMLSTSPEMKTDRGSRVWLGENRFVLPVTTKILVILV